MNLAHDMERLRDEVGRLKDQRKAFVYGLANETGALLQGFRQAHTEMAAASRGMRATFVSDLREAVGGMRRKLVDDLIGARGAWASRTTEDVQAGAELPEIMDESHPVDDLTVIPGIGAGIERRLAASGICTFSQLMSASPDELCRSLGQAGRMADVDKWIAYARKHQGRHGTA